MDPNDAPGVFAVGTRLTAVTGGKAHIAKRSLREVDDFIAVVARQRYFAGSRQIQIIVTQVIHLCCVLAEEPRSLHDFWLNQGRRNQGNKTVLQCDLHAQLHECHLHQRTRTFEEVKARP